MYFPKKETLARDLIHKVGTLIVTLAGSGSGSLDWCTVLDAIKYTFQLGPDVVEETYHNSSGPRWVFRLNGAAFATHYDRPHGMSRFNKTLGVILSIVHREKEKLHTGH
jgi:hypothetical protein